MIPRARGHPPAPAQHAAPHVVADLEEAFTLGKMRAGSRAGWMIVDDPAGVVR